MTPLKKISYSLIILFFTNAINCLDDSFDISDEIDSFVIDNVTELKRDLEVRDSTCTEVLKVLLAANIDSLLSEDLYFTTRPILKRAVTSLPTFEIFHTDHICQDKFLKFSVFGNTTTRALFTKNGPTISSYLRLDDPDYLEKLKKLQDFTDIDLEEAISLFKDAKKQERRAGIMIQALKNFNHDISFEFSIPFFYQEYNYFLTPDEIEAIKTSSVFEEGKDAELDQKEVLKFVVSDKIGFGDARVKVGFLTPGNKDNICAKIGVQSTLPIAFPFKSGIIGSFFNEKLVRPRINLQELITLNLNKNPKNNAEFKEIMKNFALDSANWLSAMVLESPLGNSGHFGLGCFIEPQAKFTKGVMVKALASVEYLFPAKENRFFLQIKNPADFSRAKFDRDINNETAACEDIAFLSEQITETVFPNIFEADICPGFILQLTICPHLRFNEWDFNFGFDFWYQQQEKIGFIYGPQSIVNSLNVKKGTKSSASQTKFFAALSYNKIKKDHDWSLVIAGEETIISSGIGKDFVLSLNFEFNY